MKLVDTERRRRVTGEHLRHFNKNKTNTNEKAAAPHGLTAAHKTQTKSRPGLLSSSTVVTPHLTLPKLLRGPPGIETGEWRRCRSLHLLHRTSLRSHGSRPRPTRH